MGNELLVLATLARCGELYGRGLLASVASMPGGRVLTTGSLYPTLARLEAKKLIQGRWGDEAARGGGGARRRYYSLTAEGLAVVRATHEATREI